MEKDDTLKHVLDEASRMLRSAQVKEPKVSPSKEEVEETSLREVRRELEQMERGTWNSPKVRTVQTAELKIARLTTGKKALLDSGATNALRTRYPGEDPVREGFKKVTVKLAAVVGP